MPHLCPPYCNPPRHGRETPVAVEAGRMAPLTIATELLELPLRHPFAIARGEERVARSVIVRVTSGERTGIGETSPSERYDETPESVAAYFATHPPRETNPYRLEALLHEDIPPAARCALDLALYDWIGNDLGKPLYELFGLDPSCTPVTSFTIGIADLPTTLRKLEETIDAPILKIKLGAGSASEQIATIEAIRSRYRGTIRIDANEGWDVDTAVRILGELRRFEIEFCEQPVPAGHPHWLRAIRERVAIPIVTDEDSRNAADLPALIGCVDGVNVKLVKTGGLRGALAMIHTARALGMKVMLGAMVESAICTTAAAHLSPLVDWADLDGPFLTARDPFLGVTYDRGKLVLPQAPGIGVRETIAA